MNTQIANPFLFDQLEVRTAVGPDGEVWFCAKDVYTALGIEWSGRAGSLKETPENWQVVLYLQTTHGVKDAVFIAEPAVYQTTFRSRKPEAKRFAEWVCGEVLPAIRRQGYYGQLPAPQQLTARKLLNDSVARLTATRDSFERALLLQQVRTLCNQLGIAVPSLELLGKDPKQLAIQGV